MAKEEVLKPKEIIILMTSIEGPIEGKILTQGMVKIIEKEKYQSINILWMEN